MEEEKKENVSGIEEAEKNLVEIFSESTVEEKEPNSSEYEVRENYENADKKDKNSGLQKVFFIILAIMIGILAIAGALTLAGVFDSKGKKFISSLKDENLIAFPLAVMKMAEKDGTTLTIL